MKEFADRLRQAQEQRGVNQKEMAALLEITPATYSAYINNQKTPALDIATKIADKLGVSMSWLCGDNREAAPKLTTYEDLLRNFVAIADTTGVRFVPNTDTSVIVISEDEDSGYYETDDERHLFESSDELEEYRAAAKAAGKNSHTCTYASLETLNYVVLSFFEGWANVRKLYQNGTVDEEIYVSWLEKRFREQAKKPLPSAEKV